MSKSISFKPVSVIVAALSVAAIWPAIGYAQRSNAMSDKPDTKTRFIWAGLESNKVKDANMMIIVRNGRNIYKTNLTAGGVDITFAKSELDSIKWCSYFVTLQEQIDDSKRCTPDKLLQPGGEIKIP